MDKLLLALVIPAEICICEDLVQIGSIVWTSLYPAVLGGPLLLISYPAFTKKYRGS